MAISNAPDFTVMVSSSLGALGVQTTSYHSLSPNSTYYFKVKISTESDSYYSSAISTITNPNPPAQPYISAVYPSSVTLTWGGAGNDAATVYLAEIGQDEAFTLNQTATMTVSNAYTFSSLTPNSTFFLRLMAVGFSGYDTGFINVGSTITLSFPPGALAYSIVSATNAVLTWNLNTNPGETYFRTVVSTNGFATINYASTTLGTSFSPYSLQPNTTHYFKTASVNAAGVESDYVVLAATLTLAAVPKQHSSPFPAANESSIEVQWLTNSNPGYTEYYISVATSSDFGGLEMGPVTWTLTPTATVNPLDSGTTFYFRVKARDLLLRETAWLFVGAKQTLAGADTTPPAVIDLQGGDNTWRGAASASYKVHFADMGSYLAKFQVRVTTGALGTGQMLANWTDVVSGINAQDYSSDWQLPDPVFQTIPENTTAYVSVRVYDNSANVTVSTDVFYVRRDTTTPTISNNAVSPAGWISSDPGAVFDVDLADALSGLAQVQYSVSSLAGSGDASILDWTNIDAITSSMTYSTNWGVDFAALSGGTTNYISVRAIDAAGNVKITADAFKILKSAGSPGVNIASPAAAYISTISAVSGGATGGNDGVTVSYVEMSLLANSSGLYWDGAGFNSASRVWLMAAGAESWSVSVATFGLVSLSSYTAVARTKDSLARYSLTYATSVFSLDQNAPSVIVSTPINASNVYVLDEIKGTHSDGESGVTSVEIAVQRVVDGKWWSFSGRDWSSVRVSSAVLAGVSDWVFIPDAYLRGSLLQNQQYFVTVAALDGAVPPNRSTLGIIGSTFTFVDGTAPGQIAQVTASSGTLPGRIKVTWLNSGDDGSTGFLAAGQFAIQYSTFIGFAYSTASAQVLITTASVASGAEQNYLISGLAAETSYYMRIWVKDDADLWSPASAEFGALSGEALFDAIAGAVRTSAGQGITGVLVEAVDGSGVTAYYSYTLDDGSGTFTLSGMDPGIYRIQATWIEDSLASSVSKDQIPVGYADTDFELEVAYLLASISGTIPSQSFQRNGFFTRASSSGVELYQAGRRIACAAIAPDGSFKISNLLPGEYSIKVPLAGGGVSTANVRVRSGENLVVRPEGSLIRNSSVYAYPNPARARVTFRLETDAASVRESINVFDISGRLVKEIKDGDPLWNRAGVLHEYTWNFTGSTPAPGVYIYKIKVRSQAGGSPEVRTGKFAVIR